jgi:transposase-like protein
LAEVFLSAAKSGTAIEAWARDRAIVAAIALQHGVSADTLRHALSRDQGGAAASPIGTFLDLVAGEGAP